MRLATLVVHTSGDPLTLAAPVRNLIREIDPAVVIPARRATRVPPMTALRPE